MEGRGGERVEVLMKVEMKVKKEETQVKVEMDERKMEVERRGEEDR